MMGRVFELIGHGKKYERAFSQRYGISLTQVISEVVACFKRTGGNLADRIKGTRLEGPFLVRRVTASQKSMS
jgi:hypothetical protein